MVRWEIRTLVVCCSVFLLGACSAPLGLEDYKTVANWTRVESIKVESPPKTAYFGGPDIPLKVKVLPSNATDPGVTWSVNSPSWVTIDSNGNLRANQGYYWSPTPVAITVMSRDRPEITDSFIVDVWDAHLNSISLGSGLLRVNLDSAFKTLDVVPTPLIASLPNLSWSSSNSEVATVSQEGVVTPVSIGQTTIQASGGGFVAERTLYVVAPGVISGVTATPSIELSLGTIADLRETIEATVWPENASNRAVTWMSQNTTIATVDASGNVTALAPGKTTITVAAAADVQVYASCEVTVTATSSVSAVTLPLAAVVDMKYSRSLDRLVVLQNNPARLTLYDPSTGGTLYRTLTSVPLGLGLSPNGKLAVVGNDGSLDLFGLELTGIGEPTHWSVEKQSGYGVNRGNLTSVSVTDSAVVYAIDGWDQWIDLRRIDGTTGAEAFLYVGSLWAGSKGLVHPSNQTFYFSDGGMKAVDISQPTATTVPHYGKSLSAGKFWFFDNGNRLVAQSGKILNVTQQSATDFSEVGLIPAFSTGTADHHGSATVGESLGVLAVVRKAYSTQPSTLFWYDDDTFQPLKATILPAYVRSGDTEYWTGKYAFWNAAGTRLYVLMDKSETSEDVWAMATYEQ